MRKAILTVLMVLVLVIPAYAAGVDPAILSDGRRVGYKTFENVLHFWEGSYLQRTAQGYYDWGVVAKHFEAMRLLGELQDTIKPLPSINGQLTLMFEAEDKKSSVFTFSQEIIDAVLTRGSGISEGKMRIYEQFEKVFPQRKTLTFSKMNTVGAALIRLLSVQGLTSSTTEKVSLFPKGLEAISRMLS